LKEKNEELSNVKERMNKAKVENNGGQ